jgi:hypothetical protein
MEIVVYKRMHGEQKDANFLAAESWIEDEWPKIVSELWPRNVYNSDENGFVWTQLFVQKWDSKSL